MTQKRKGRKQTTAPSRRRKGSKEMKKTKNYIRNLHKKAVNQMKLLKKGTVKNEIMQKVRRIRKMKCVLITKDCKSNLVSIKWRKIPRLKRIRRSPQP